MEENSPSPFNRDQQDRGEDRQGFMPEEQVSTPVVTHSFAPAAVVSPEPSPPPPRTLPHTPPPPPSLPAMSPQSAGGVVPMPVVRVLSPRGVEYVFMTVALLTGALGLGSALISLVNGKTEFSVMAFPAATLLVSVPVFAWLFLRLKATELADPSLRLDPSKRRSTQFIQIASFLVSFFTVIGYVSAVFDKMSGDRKSTRLNSSHLG